MRYLNNDQSRCNGAPESDLCATCRRKLQSEIDAPALFYRQTGAAINPDKGCDIYLPVQSGSKGFDKFDVLS